MSAAPALSPPEPGVLGADSFQAATGATSRQMADLEHYRALLAEGNERLNLVGPSALADFWNRHAYDSWQLLPLTQRLVIPAAVTRGGAESRDDRDPNGGPGQPAVLSRDQGGDGDLRPEGLRSPGGPGAATASPLSAAFRGSGRDDKTSTALTWADLGAGAGLPGVVLAIFLKGRESAVVHLIDSLAKRCRFLTEVASALDLPAEVHNARAESLALSVDVVTARACAPLTRLFGYAHPTLRRSGVGLFLKGEGAAAELEAAREAWTFDAELSPSLSDPRGRVVTIRSLHPRAPSRRRR